MIKKGRQDSGLKKVDITKKWSSVLQNGHHLWVERMDRTYQKISRTRYRFVCD